VLCDRVARPALAARVEERRSAGLPGGAAGGLVAGELVLEVVADVDTPHACGRLGVEDPDLTPREVDVFAA
jgi:hypothetical protein